MATSPYQPPKAPVGDRGPDVRRGSTALAILAGVGIDIVATEIGLFVYGMLLELPAVMSLALAGDRMGGETISFLIGLAATGLGGYAAAWVANRQELFHGLYFGIATIAVSEALLLIPAIAPTEPIPMWRQTLWYLLAIPVAIGGAWLRKRRKRAAEPA